MEFTLEEPFGTGVCETCAERGRPNEPVYKLGDVQILLSRLAASQSDREAAGERANGRLCNALVKPRPPSRICRP